MLADVRRPVESVVLEKDGLHLLADFDADRKHAFVGLQHRKCLGAHLKSGMAKGQCFTGLRKGQTNFAQPGEYLLFVHLELLPAYYGARALVGGAFTVL